MTDRASEGAHSSFVGTAYEGVGSSATPIRRPGPLAARTQARRSPVDKGVAVSIGPVAKSNQWVQEWMTFPLTPETLPVAVSGSWNDVQIVGAGERSSFVGPNLDVITFSGILEPPEFYIASEAAGLFSGVTDRVGAMDAAYEAERLRQAGFQPGLNPGIPDLGDGTNGVVMQSGARAGPNVYYEPHAFKKCIEGAVKNGEIVKLVVGDDYGWTGHASIREFNWRYEDPDPDTLYFDITFKQHVTRKLRAAQQKRKEPKHSTIVTKKGDTLKKIAVREWGEVSKWTMIRDLNKYTLSQLWYYGKKDGESPESIGKRIAGKKYGHKVGLKGAKVTSVYFNSAGNPINAGAKVSHAKDVKQHFDLTDMSGDTHFRAGVRLKVKKDAAGPKKVGDSAQPTTVET